MSLGSRTELCRALLLCFYVVEYIISHIVEVRMKCDGLHHTFRSVAPFKSPEGTEHIMCIFCCIFVLFSILLTNKLNILKDIHSDEWHQYISKNLGVKYIKS